MSDVIPKAFAIGAVTVGGLLGAMPAAAAAVEPLTEVNSPVTPSSNDRIDIESYQITQDDRIYAECDTINVTTEVALPGLDPVEVKTSLPGELPIINDSNLAIHAQADAGSAGKVAADVECSGKQPQGL